MLQIIAASGQPKVDFVPLGFMDKNEIIPSNAKLHTVEKKRFILDSECRKYVLKLNEIIQEGSIRMPSTRVLKVALTAVESCLEEEKQGNLAGEKLVVSLIDC